MIYLGICGPAGSGKTTLQKYICEKYGYLSWNFADALKRGLEAMFHIPHAMLESPDLKEVAVDHLGVTPRRLMQFVGTEGVRACDQNLWVNQLRFDLRKFLAAMEMRGTTYPGVVIADMRFENEADFIRNKPLGIVIHVGGRKKVVSSHSSESGLSINIEDDVIIDNSGDFAHLCNQADRLIAFVEERQMALSGKRPEPSSSKEEKNSTLATPGQTS